MDETSIEIGDKIIPFYDTFVFLSSYKNERAKKDAVGPYWASIVGSDDNYIIVRFVGYSDDFDVFLHREDLPELSYKFQLLGSDVFNRMEYNLLDVKAVAEAVEDHPVTMDEARAIHNNNLYEAYITKTVPLEQEYDISPAILTQLTSYNEYNSRTDPFFTSNKGSGVLHPDMAKYQESSADKKAVTHGSRDQWIDVNVKGDGNCMFRAVANGINYNTSGERWGYSNPEQEKLQAKLRDEAVTWLCDPKNQNKVYIRYSDGTSDTVKEQVVDEAVQSGFIPEMKRPLDREPPQAKVAYETWSQKAVQAYCREKHKDGSLGRDYWGSDLELFALANIYDMAINVYYRTIPRDRSETPETVEASYDNYKRRFAPEGEPNSEINIYWKGLNHYHTLYPNRK